MQSRGGNPALSALSHVVPSKAETPQMLTAREVAHALGVSAWTLVNWRRPGNTSAPSDLPWFYDRGRVVYRAADVRAFLARHRADLEGQDAAA